MKFGIIQGRLTPSRGRGIQFFPEENWEKEFFVARDLGLGNIEWVFDYSKFDKNPLWTDVGIQEIRCVIEKTDVAVHTVCFDYFMRRPFYKRQDDIGLRDENLSFIRHIAQNLAAVGGRIVEVPLVDDAAIQNERERGAAIGFLKEASDGIPQNVIIAIETDMPPGAFRAFLEEVGRDNVRANYDLGDSTGRGYDSWEEICSLNEYVENVHIKDKPICGTTVELGKGAADFSRLFSALAHIGYEKGITLQVARGQDGEETSYISRQMKFVQKFSKNLWKGEK